jgi:hypothetical protein
MSLRELLERIESNAELIGATQGRFHGETMPTRDALAVHGLRKANDEFRGAILARYAQ